MGYVHIMAMISDEAQRAWSGVVELFMGGSHQNRFVEAAQRAGLTPAACKTLLMLDGDEPVPMRNLADVLHCDASNVTQLVDALESPGYVERLPSPTDRRVKLVGLTDVGTKTRAQVLETIHTPPPSLGRLTRAEQAELARLLAKVTAPE
jgi:DNA-binding MarR family transcriptional regulator